VPDGRFDLPYLAQKQGGGSMKLDKQAGVLRTNGPVLDCFNSFLEALLGFLE
jgi:hypothetical protein